MNWTDSELSEKLVFSENGIYKRIRENGVTFGPFEWNLIGKDSIKMDVKILKIVLTDTSMVLSINYLNFGEPAYAISVYKGFKK